MSYPDTGFPGSLDNPTNPSASSDTSVFDHAGLHSFENNAIKALETKVGANSSGVTTSHDYKLSGVTGSAKAVSTDLSNMPHGGTSQYGVVKTSTSTDTAVSTDDTRIPSTGQGQALTGSQGVPSASNPYVTLDNVYTGQYDQSQATQNLSLEFGMADTATNKNIVSQSFIPAKTKISGVLLYKNANSGTYTGNVTVTVQADSGGSPSGVALATTTIANATYNALSTGEFTATFSSEISLTVGSTYWIVVSSSTSDSTNHPNLGVNTAGGYANGFVKYKNTTDGWVSIAGDDLYFKTVQGVKSQVVETDSNGFVIPSIIPKTPIGSNFSDVATSTAISATTTATVFSKNLPTSFFTASSGISIKGQCITQLSPVNSSYCDSAIVVKLNGNTISTFTITTGGGTVTSNYEIIILNNNSLSSQNIISSTVGYVGTTLHEINMGTKSTSTYNTGGQQYLEIIIAATAGTSAPVGGSSQATNKFVFIDRIVSGL